MCKYIVFIFVVVVETCAILLKEKKKLSSSVNKPQDFCDDFGKLITYFTQNYVVCFIFVNKNVIVTLI